MDRMGRTDQLVHYSDGRYLTFDPAEVAGCSAAPYVTDTRQSAQLHSLRASRLSPPTPPHYARECVLRLDVWMVRSSQTSTYCACAGGRGAEADLRHVSVSERPTTDIRETCTCFHHLPIPTLRSWGAPLLTMFALARIGLVDYYRRAFTANDPQWKPKEARKPHNSSRKRSAQTRCPHFTRS